MRGNLLDILLVRHFQYKCGMCNGATSVRGVTATAAHMGMTLLTKETLELSSLLIEPSMTLDVLVVM